MHTLLILSIMIFAGMAFGRLAKLFRLPNVTGYLIAGLLLGPAIQTVVFQTRRCYADRHCYL